MKLNGSVVISQNPALSVQGSLGNYAKNPSFEVNVTDDWTISGAGGTRTLDAVVYKVGAASARILAGNAGVTVRFETATGMSVPANGWVTISGWIRNGGATPANCNLLLRDVTNSADRATVASTLATTWEWVSCSWQNTTGAQVIVALRCRNAYGDNATNCWFDAMQLEAREAALSYCDGTQTGCYWTGTAHNSTSGRYVSPERFSRTLVPGQYDGLRMSKRALGKYHRCTFRIHGDRYSMQEMFTNGLMREVRVYGPDGRPHWGGFIYEMKFNLGWIEATVSMSEVYNRIWLRYRITGSSTTVRSTAQNGTPSQGKYGVKEYVISAGELQTSVVADQVAAQYLELFQIPKVTPRIFFDRPLLQRPYIEITAYGWKDTLNFMVFNNAGAASEQSSPAEIDDIVAASGQFIAATHLDGNATQVSKISDLDRRAGDFIDDITRLGDPDNNRWVNGVDIDRNLIFKQAEPPE